MNKYVDKSAVIKYLQEVAEVCMQNCEFETYDNLIGIIREIEDEEVLGLDIIDFVRCCDCKYCRTRIDECGNYTPHCSKSFGNMEVDPLDYCSYGKRKE